MNKRNPWTESELEILTDETLSVDEAAALLPGKNRAQIVDKRTKLVRRQRIRTDGTTQRFARAYTESELALLADRSLSHRQVSDLIDRPAGSISTKRHSMRKDPTPTTGTGPAQWTADEDAVIRSTSDQRAAVAAEILGRTRAAVYNRRVTLRLADGQMVDRIANEIDPNNIPPNGVLLAKTCVKCGLLMDAAWFHLGSVCKGCIRGTRVDHGRVGQAQRNAYSKKLQSLSMPALRNGIEYTSRDFEVMADPLLTMFQKALRLERSYYAIVGAVHRYGFKSRHSEGLGDPADGVWNIEFPAAAATAA